MLGAIWCMTYGGEAEHEINNFREYLTFFLLKSRHRGHHNIEGSIFSRMIDRDRGVHGGGETRRRFILRVSSSLLRVYLGFGGSLTMT